MQVIWSLCSHCASLARQLAMLEMTLVSSNCTPFQQKCCTEYAYACSATSVSQVQLLCSMPLKRGTLSASIIWSAKVMLILTSQTMMGWLHSMQLHKLGEVKLYGTSWKGWMTWVWHSSQKMEPLSFTWLLVSGAHNFYRANWAIKMVVHWPWDLLGIVPANGRSDILRLLLARDGAYEAVRHRDSKGGSPAHDAAHQGRLSCLKMLVEAGLSLNQRDQVGASEFWVCKITL